MKRILIGGALALLSVAAVAATVGVSWTNATLNVDGSSIPGSGAGSIESTRVEYGTCDGTAFGQKLGEVVTPGSVQATDTPNLGPGRYCLRAFHINTYGVESDPTGVVVKVIDAPKPRPPENFSAG